MLNLFYHKSVIINILTHCRGFSIIKSPFYIFAKKFLRGFTIIPLYPCSHARRQTSPRAHLPTSPRVRRQKNPRALWPISLQVRDFATEKFTRRKHPVAIRKTVFSPLHRIFPSTHVFHVFMNFPLKIQKAINVAFTAS